MQLTRLLYFIFLSVLCANAQKTIDTQSLVWYGYSINFKINPRWNIVHNVENRQFWFPGRQHQFISVNKGFYNFKNGLKVAPGITLFQITRPQDPFADNATGVWEIRPHIEAIYTVDVSPKLKFQNRALLEWRYFENDNKNFAFRNYRYRHRIQLSYRLNKRFGFRLYDELLINLGSNIVNNTFDQNRLGIATKVYAVKGLAFELGYLNWFQQQSTGQDFYNRHIVQCTVSKRIDFNKNNKK